jgi:hypothetical protein
MKNKNQEKFGDLRKQICQNIIASVPHWKNY